MAVSVQGAVEELPRLNVAEGQSSISGLSSGAFMTVQLHVAHSESFVGAGVIAGGPYRCAESFRGAQLIAEDAYEQGALYIGMNPLVRQMAPDVGKAIERTGEALRRGRIDPLNLDHPTDHIRNQRVYIFTGSNDRVVSPSVVAKTRDYYRRLGVLAGNIRYVDDVPAGHAIITDRPEFPELGANRPPYINDGGFVQAAAILDHIYPKRLYPGMGNPPANRPAGRLIRFLQEPFVATSARGGGFTRSSLSKYGYAYLPSNVDEGGVVRVHIALHGCRQGYNYVNFVNGRADIDNQPPFGDRYMTATGYNEYAEANGIVVLYPQVEGSDGGELQNPKGCWDWWGYTCDPGSGDDEDCDYYSRNAIQIKAIRGMLGRLGG